MLRSAIRWCAGVSAEGRDRARVRCSGRGGHRAHARALPHRSLQVGLLEKNPTKVYYAGQQRKEHR